MNRISLDFETRSPVDLKKFGAYKYAEHPDTKVLVIAVQRHGSDAVHTWDVREPATGDNKALAMLKQAIEERWEIHAFNSGFEWAILKHVCPRQFGWPVPDINTMRCTAAVCRSAGMPPSLAKSAEFLKLPIQKDTVGLALIRKFSVPQKDGGYIEPGDAVSFTLAGEKVTAAAAFQKFVDYCAQDVRTEMAVAKVMEFYELKGFALEWFLLDMRLNDRGVPVDLEALRAAQRFYKRKEKLLAHRFKEITGLSPTQRDRCLEWFQARGYKKKSLDKANRALALKDPELTGEVREALEIKGDIGYAALKKIPSMISMAMTDGKIRGTFLWCGAQKTWRWASKTPQWQNMKKPPKWLRPVIESAYQCVRKEELDLDAFEMIYGPPYEVVASLARYFVRFPDQNIFDLDFSSVEARILPFLIEAVRIMEKIRTGGDIYTATGKALESLLKERFKADIKIDRDKSKVLVLATQFQGGWRAAFTATGEVWPREWCEAAVKVVREENPELPAAWKAFQNAFVTAFDHPGKWIHATRYVSFGYTAKGPFPRMMMRLPSGRFITYPYPERKPITMAKVNVVKDGKTTRTTWERLSDHMDDESAIAKELGLGDKFLYPDGVLETWFHTYELSFYGHIKDKLYGRVNTYGGDLLQSATQGVGADLLAHGALQAESAGFDPFFLVHDQALTPDNGRKDDFERAMCCVPDWFKGFPLEAEADSVRSYCKS